MSTGPLPPMGGNAGPLKCGRLLRYPDPASRCPNEPKSHIIWTEDCENGLVCQEHADEALRQWAFYAIHDYRMECSMPGAIYVYAENICVVDEDGLGLHAVELPSVAAAHSQHGGMS